MEESYVTVAVCIIIRALHYMLCWIDVPRSVAVIAKFHYTDPTGPARTRTDFFAAKLRWVRAGRRQSPCGSVRVRVVEFSY